MKQKKQYFYNTNFNHKNDSNKNNSPSLSHQENNYYYNTKINHIFFQDYTNNHPIKRKIEKSSLFLDNRYINNNILESNFDDKNKIITRNLENSYYKSSNSLKKADRFHKIKIDLNETEINMNSKINYEFGPNISTTRNKNTNNSYSQNFFNGNKTTANNYNVYTNSKDVNKGLNYFQGYNKLIKKNNINKNDIDCNISENIKNNQNNTYLDLRSCKNINNNYFYNIQNNYEKNDSKHIKKNLLGKNNIFLSDLSSNVNYSKDNEINNKKIELKTDRTVNYLLKSPTSADTQRKNKNKNEKVNNNQNLLGKQKIKINESKNNQNNSSNKFLKNLSNNNNKDLHNNENNNIKNIINVNKKVKNKINNNINKGIKRNAINNINIYNSLPKKASTNKMNPKNIKIEKMNNNKDNINKSNINETYMKINQKNCKNKINYYYNQLNLTNNKDEMIKKLKKFCDILEKFFYVSFKKSYQYFIQKIISYIEYLNSKRALIIRRFAGVKKRKKLTNNSFNNNISFNSINDKLKLNKEINYQIKKSKSPSKFLELHDNIKSSLMEINQDNYIQKFSILFSKDRKNSMEKKYKSPFIERAMKDSFNIDNVYNTSSINDKYKTKTNNDFLYYPKKGNFIPKYVKINGKAEINNNNSKNNHYRYKINNNKFEYENENNNYIGNIFDDDESLNFIRENYSIDGNFKKDNSDKNLFDLSDKKYKNKNLLLYSKPKLANSMSKEDGLAKKNNLNIICLKKSQRNCLHNSMSNNIFSPIKNIKTYKNIPIDKKRKENKINEIIVKNAHTNDNRLNVFIKYIKLENHEVNQICKDKLIISKTDSIEIIGKYINSEKNYNLNNKIEINNQEKINVDSNLNEENKSKIIYLINFLQNILNDNKKTILYNFWKNLQKIRTNFLLHNSLQAKKLYKSIKCNNQNVEKQKVIDLKENKPSMIAAKNNQQKKNCMIIDVNLQNKINKENDTNNFLYNKNCNNITYKKEKKVERNYNKKSDLEKKDELKKIKLDKLGKLFKNLEQENNIISTIKEQFLDWTNKNDIDYKKEKNKNNNCNKGNNVLVTHDINNNESAKNEKGNDLDNMDKK